MSNRGEPRDPVPSSEEKKLSLENQTAPVQEKAEENDEQLSSAAAFLLVSSLAVSLLPLKRVDSRANISKKISTFIAAIEQVCIVYLWLY